MFFIISITYLLYLRICANQIRIKINVITLCMSIKTTLFFDAHIEMITLNGYIIQLPGYCEPIHTIYMEL